VQEIYSTIAELPEDFRLALVAVDVLGLSSREASRALKVREATLTTRLFRARKQIAGKLADEQAQPPAPSSPQSQSREGNGADGVLSGGES
jgi:DNA-directed RNA polymerase specialized sigma24 family protein